MNLPEYVLGTLWPAAPCAVILTSLTPINTNTFLFVTYSLLAPVSLHLDPDVGYNIIVLNIKVGFIS